MRRAAWLHAALVAVVVLFHLAAISGAPVGHLTMGGRWPGALPPELRVGSALSALLLVLLAAIVLARAGIVRLRLPGWLIWAVVAVHALGAFVHVITPSAAERALWLPVILVMLACALVVARSR